ncbi:MAG TPA: hypothetical protein PLL10_11160, partial [Elusimicrobiales bacterium]|nr:hypothetical protein [Elusimicrobiales bacterium]
MPKKKKILIREFVVRVYTSGEIFMDGFDELVFWKMNQKTKDGFLPYAYKIQRFGMCVESGQKADKYRVSRRQ